MLQLVSVDEYWLKGKNRYVINANNFGITKDELLDCLIFDDKAYLNKIVCEKLQLLNEDLKKNYNMEVIIKDAYRSEKLYQLIMYKRSLKEWTEFVQKSFNTKWDFPHSTGNTVDVAFVDLATSQQLECTKEILDNNERRKSRALSYYENSTDKHEQEIHKNRLFIKQMMEKYWFQWIPHEYWHFNYQD